MAAKIVAGASGYSFKEWCGSFYPEKTRAEEMLPFYSARLPTVEINNTFYKFPRANVMENWRDTTPAGFRFAIKSPRRITHIGRLKPESVTESMQFLYGNLTPLGEKRGPVLFQCPPMMKKDLARLNGFLALLPQHHGAAFEFRTDSWFCDDVYDALKSAGAALVLSEREDRGSPSRSGDSTSPPPLVETAPWGYLRLRLEQYSDADLAQWAKRIQATGWKEAFVYFMHEPTAPAYAAALMKHGK